MNDIKKFISRCEGSSYIVMKGFGFAGVIARIPAFRRRAIQVPKYTIKIEKEDINDLIMIVISFLCCTYHHHE